MALTGYTAAGGVMLEMTPWEFGLVPAVGLGELTVCWLRARLWFRAAVPLDQALVPLPGLPEGAGHTATVSWEITEREAVWWAHREGPWGLHGRVVFGRRGPHTTLNLTWAPPWTGIVLVVWVSSLGARHGVEPSSSIGCTLLMLMLILGYRQAAIRAAAELRWAFTQALDEQD